jgi:hypothetical protein
VPDELVLPIINKTLTDADYQQLVIIKKYQEYFKACVEKNPNYEFDSEFLKNHDGLCSGLTAYWLYCKRIGEEGKFIHLLEYILSWDKDKFKRSNQKSDKVFEEFFNNIKFLHNVDTLLPGIERHDLEQSFATILHSSMAAVAKPEFCLTFVFDKKMLDDLISKHVHPNKMIRFGNALHTVGMIYSGGVYYFYDSSSPLGPMAYNSCQSLVLVLFESLAKFCKSTDYIALNMSIFDLVDEKPNNYPSALEYCESILQDKKYKKSVLAHPNILRVALRYDNQVLELLFKSGYKYVPSNNYNMTELGEMALERNTAKVIYLLQHDIPINYRPPHGLSALDSVIQNKSNDMVNFLLQCGATPDLNSFRLAAVLHNLEALVMLFAVTPEFDEDILQLLTRYFTREEIKFIKDQALILNAKYLHLDQAQDINAYIKHGHLKTKLYPNDVVFGLNTIETTTFNEFNAALKDTVSKITKQSLDQHATQDMINLAIIIEELDILCKRSSPLHPYSILIAKQALASKNKLISYLHNNNISTSKVPHKKGDFLLFSSKHREQYNQFSYDEDILPIVSLSYRLE